MLVKTVFWAACGALLIGSPAWAQDKPVVAPPEAWVSPPQTVQAKPQPEAAVQMLSEDVQLHFDGRSQSQYLAYSAKLNNAAGMAGLGTVGFRWSPAIQTLTVHHLRLLRGSQVIDLRPKDGAFTVLRREERLESDALIDGVLTAVVHPSGLEVGDVLDVAYTVRTTDPIMNGVLDAVLAGFDAAPISHLRILADWPVSAPVRWRTAKTLPSPTVVIRDGRTFASVELDDLKVLEPPRGAPARFLTGRELSLSTFADWSAASNLMGPLFEEAARLAPDSAVAAQAAAIAARSADPAVRAGLALALVEDKVRYLADAIGDNGLKPASADLTWSRRWGDCKAKTVLLIALLKSLGIQAEPVLVNTRLGDGIDKRLPSLRLFDHVLVRAFVNGRPYWLDGTRLGDTQIARLTRPNYGWALPLHPGAQLEFLQAEPLQTADVGTSYAIDARAGRDIPASVHAEAVMRGESGRGMRLALQSTDAQALDRALRNYWAKEMSDLVVTKVSATPDAATGDVRLAADGTLKIDWSRAYEPEDAFLGFKPDLRREPGPDADAPVDIAFPYFTESETTIRLPDGGRGYSIAGSNVDKVLYGYALHRRATITDGVFRIETSRRTLQNEISLAKATADAVPVTEMAKTTLKVVAPTGPVRGGPAAAAKPDGREAMMAVTPTGRDDYLKRGYALNNAGRSAEAVADFDKAVALDPGSATAFANRGLANAFLGRVVAARTDLDHAEALDPENLVVWNARGVLADSQGRWGEAVEAYTHALKIRPNAEFALSRRAGVYVVMKSTPEALADIDAALKADPAADWAYSAKLRLFVQAKDFVSAGAVIEEASVKGRPPEVITILRTYLLREQHERGQAIAEVDKALALKPTARLHLLHAAVRERTDLAGRRADALAALALDPQSTAAMSLLMATDEKEHDYKSALGWAEKLKVKAPTDTGLDFTITRLKLRAGGDAAVAKTETDAIRARISRDAVRLNNLCYDQAVNGFDLVQALADCDASLKLAPETAATLDSRAFVLMRQGRDTEALAAYDAALVKRPDFPTSLYGRSLVEARLGRTGEAERDRRAAVELSPDIEADFADMGTTR
ncbi:hypothetical protein BH09PSE2_BH09PSE2_12490 [soil metagenome]